MKSTTSTQESPAPPGVPEPIGLDDPAAYRSRELSWLAFARRVLALVQTRELALLERVKFAGIMGMLHDEFFMKRMSGLKRLMAAGSQKRSVDGRLPREEFDACRAELLDQVETLARVMAEEIRPDLAAAGIPIYDYGQLGQAQQADLRRWFQASVQPVLTPLAVDAEHPFPFISNLTLNVAAMVPDERGRKRFVRIKVPQNRPRWIPLAAGGFVPLEQIIAANADLMFPAGPPTEIYVFRVTRSAEGHPERSAELSVEDVLQQPGMIVQVVADELRARRFAGSVRLQIDPTMPDSQQAWLTRQLGLTKDDVYPTENVLGLTDFSRFHPEGYEHLRLPAHTPVTHPRLRDLVPGDAAAIFEEIDRGDILLHHPYHSFDTSVLRFLESAARDPQVLAIKLTIYRTSSDSPIVRALAEASRRGKQVAVLVEITARFDEAPNIAWGKYLEEEGVHVAYGVERLKTHVKLALVVREEEGVLRRYAHIGTGNYHTGTARLYEDLGMLTADEDLCADVAAVFDALTGASSHGSYRKLLVAPQFMRGRFQDLIRREAEHARAGRPSGIRAKMNQLEDEPIIRELYLASRAGVPVRLVVRGLCSLRAGVPGLSENIHVSSVVGRFLEHSRIYRFENGGKPELFLGSADWMRRNLDHRVETIAPVRDARIQKELTDILDVYARDNASAWDAQPDGTYVRRRPADGEDRREAQEVFIREAQAQRD